MRAVLTIITLLICAPAFSESISYSITSEKLLWWDKELISEGTLNYSASDIVVEDRIGFKSKHLHVSEAFNVGASIYREAKIEGFGLWINKGGAGFSWEWFTRKKGNIYRKLQESGSVSVEFREIEGLQEIKSIEFLEDVSMRLDTLNFILFWNKETHRMLVKKGSKLVFLSPNQSLNSMPKIGAN